MPVRPQRFDPFSCVLSFLVLGASICPAVRSQSHSLVLDDSITVAVVEAINTNELDKADRILDAQLSREPTSLKWLFLKGMRYFPEIFTPPTSNQRALEGMRKHMARVTELGEAILDRDDEDPEALFFTGGAYGYLGLALFADKSVFGGISSAKKGFKMQEELIGLHPKCYDAYLGPGMMNLLTSAIPGWLQPIMWLFGLSGTEEKAYEYLTIAYEKGTLVRLEAGTYLAQLYQRRKDLNRSAEIYGELTRKYPMRVVLRAESFSPLWEVKRYSDIRSSAAEMIRSFEQGRYAFTIADSAWMPSILVSYANSCKELGDTTSAIDMLENFISQERHRGISQWRMRMSLAESYARRKDTVKVAGQYDAILNSNAPEDTKTRVRKALERWRPAAKEP